MSSNESGDGAGTAPSDAPGDSDPPRFGRHRGRADGPLLRADRVTAAVVAVAAVALLARLAFLGARPFHWDEARVGYWTLRFLRTGAFEYRPVAGGPFLYVVGRHAFALLGASDAVARLPVVVLGGLLPAVALLFRGRLRDDETVFLAAVLAADPLLLYYSRFLRGDVPLAAFGLAAVGFAVRTRDAGSWRALYAAAAAAGLAWAASGFAPAYLVCWAVAAALVFDHRALLGRSLAPGALGRLRRRLRAWLVPLARAYVVWFAVVLYFFAPRAGGGEGPGLWDPATFPVAVERAVFGAPWAFLRVRVLGRHPDATHALTPFVSDLGGVLLAAALPLVSLSAYAFVRDRYGPGGPRPVVAFHAYWGFAAAVVFPVVTEVAAPWVGVHVVAPLALPAAVGGTSLLRDARAATDRRDAATAAAAVLVALALVAQAGTVAAGVYAPVGADADADAAGGPLVQYAQPTDDLDPFYRNVSRAADGGEGVDVLYVGDRFYLADDRAADAPPVPDAWGNRLPLPWYVERAGADAASVRNLSDFGGDAPPVVVADPARRGRLAARLPGYEAAAYRLALSNRRVVVFVRR